MTAAADKQRLTVAVLDRAECVLPAVDALVDGGVDQGRIGVAAASVSLDRLEQLAGPAHRRRGWLARVLGELQPAAAGVEATPGPLLSLLAGRLPQAAAARRDGWISPERQEELLTFIRGGCIVLGVTTSDMKQQWASVRLFLAQPADEVWTFECTPENAPRDT